MIWKNITRKKARSLLTILGISIGITSIVFLMAVMGGLEAQFISIVERSGANLIILQKDSTDLMLSRLRENVTQRLAQVPGVAEVSSVLFMVTKVEGYPFFVVSGLKVDEFMIDHFKVVEGRSLTEQDKGKMLLGKKAAAHLNKGLNEKITIFEDEYEIVGIYETGIKFEEYGGVIPLDEAQKTFDLEGFVSLIEVRVEDPARLDEIKAIISQNFSDVDVNLPREVYSKQEDLQLIRSATSLVSVVAILFGAIIIMNTMVMSVYERTREIGILRALGWKKKSVLIMILKETILLALMGGFAGISAAVIGIHFLEKIAVVPFSGQINLELFMWGIIAALSLGFLGGIYPAVRAARMDPIKALGHEV